MTIEHEAHEAASVFPMMSEAELAALAADIAEHGLREPIVRIKNGSGYKILDGRNRERACQIAKVKASYRDFSTRRDGKDPVAFVISENIARRHLSESQRAMVAARLAGLGLGSNQHAKRGSANLPTLPQGEAAARVNVAERSVRSARAVLDKGTAALVAAVERDQIAVSAAADIAKLPEADQDAALARLDLEDGKQVRPGLARAYAKQAQKALIAEQINREPVPMPAGPFRVIVSDPPWNYGKRVGDPTHRGDLPYPAMATDAICELGVGDIAHPEGCVLWLWTTNAFMRDAFCVLDAWGFEEKTILTWVKNKIGLGDWLRGQTEHCILAVRGKPTITLTNETTVLNGPVREHSRKPDEFYDLVEKLCPGSKVEMFCRQARAGWSTWGAETGLFDAR